MRIKIEKESRTIDAEDIIEREIKPFGTNSAHIIVPKKWLGHKVVLIMAGKVKQWLGGYAKKYKKALTQEEMFKIQDKILRKKS